MDGKIFTIIQGYKNSIYEVVLRVAVKQTVAAMQGSCDWPLFTEPSFCQVVSSFSCHPHKHHCLVVSHKLHWSINSRCSVSRRCYSFQVLPSCRHLHAAKE